MAIVDSGEHPTILIVDDRPENVSVMARVLKRTWTDAAIRSATEAEHGLAIATAETPDVAIIDVQMPGMGGIELCRRLQSDVKTRPMPVIMITSHHSTAELRAAALEAGASEFVSRPIDNVELVARVGAMLRIKHGEDQLRLVNRTLEKLVTQRTEQARIKEARYRALVNSATEHIFMLDRDGVYVTSNESAERGDVSAAAPVMGRSIEEVYPDETAALYRCEFETVRDTAQPRALEYTLPHPDGDRYYLVVLFPIAVDGDVHGVGGICRDVTAQKNSEAERVRLEQHLWQAQKLESMGTFAGGVAHEINNPINGIMNYAQLIRDRMGGSNPVLDEYAGEIILETERMATIVRNLFSFAGREKHERSRFAVCEIVESTLSLVRAVFRHDQITLEVDVPEDLPALLCSSQQIRQAIMNLLTNARDALNEKYEGYHEDKIIRVSARTTDTLASRESDPWQAGNGQPVSAGRWLRLTVEDHGPGIPEEVKDRVFDPFYTTKPRHTWSGLGLATSHGIVEDHGGEICIETEPGAFTRVHIDLPITAE